MLVMKRSKLCDHCANGDIKGLETQARRSWFRFRMGNIQENCLEMLAPELELEGPREMEWEKETV